MNLTDQPEHTMTAERLKSLYELIGRMNSVYELSELLEFVVDRALSLTHGRRGVLLLSDEHEPDKLRQLAVVQGEELDKQHLEQTLKFISTTVIKDVLDRGEPRLVADLHTDQRYEGLASDVTLQFKKTRSVLAVPLKTDEQLVGLLYIDHPQQAVFGQSDLDFLSAFASQAALAINRAREHQRQIEELTRLNELSRSVVQVLDLDEVLSRIVQEATRMLNVETGSVILLDEETDELTFAISISQGRRIEIPTRLKKDQGIAGQVMSTGQPACVNDVANNPHWFGEVEHGFSTRSLLSVPLRLDGRILGTLQVLNKKSPAGFDPSDTTRLSAFAAWATIAIENARLFREARQAGQLRVLNEAALALSSSLNLETILNIGLEQALSILKADAGMICLTHVHGDRITLPAAQVSRGLSPEPAAAERQSQALAQLAASTIQRGVDEPTVIDRIDLQAGQNQRNLFEANVALAPLKVGDKVSGVLIVMNHTPHTYNADEIDLLISLARIIGLAVQNAANYNRVSSQAMHLTYFNEVGSALTSSLDLDHVLKVIIEGVNALLETERTSVFLIDEETHELVLRYSNDRDADIRLPPGEGIAGWVAANDQPALVNNTLSDPRHLREVAINTGYEAHSILCVPLKVEGQVIGVVEVLNKTGNQQFNRYHQELLVELTKWAAIAIHNAHLFNERVRAYQSLNTEQQRRIAAETRAAMAAVILDIAHTMNNVVGAIRVWAATLEYTARHKPQSSLGNFLKEAGNIRQNAEEAIRLIRTMTDPLEKATIAPTDVHACLEAAIQSCWWPDNIHLSKNYSSDLPLVKANAKRLEAAFHNLLSNAVQAMTQDSGQKGGGQIRVRTRRLSEAWVEITIADNGPGIPLELQESIFNPGVSGKAEGLGIGLWLVETFVHQFEGRIDFTSVPGKGTTFAITLQPMEIEVERNE
ncbi:MAG: GAF domain-containing protein [Anaerolineae bacterium]|nr:GAF domain-containing protein [Anaerolineae bacterium]